MRELPVRLVTPSLKGVLRLVAIVIACVLALYLVWRVRDVVRLVAADTRSGKRRRTGKRSDRKPGGQPGHPGTGRGLLPIEPVDEVIQHLPERCRKRGHSLDPMDQTPGA